MIIDEILKITSEILLNFSGKCAHSSVSPEVEVAYCPDCGKLIKNEWYIARCNCCGVKMKAMVKNGKIIPQNRFCTNCGKNDYTVEKLDQINFIDINFAALLRREIDEERHFSSTTCWQEKTHEQPKLLVQY